MLQLHIISCCNWSFLDYPAYLDRKKIYRHYEALEDLISPLVDYICITLEAEKKISKMKRKYTMARLELICGNI